MGNSFCGGPDFWGPSSENEALAISNGRWSGAFDFSTCFEDALIVSASVALLILATVGRVIYLRWTKNANAYMSPLLRFKILVASALLLFEFAVMVEAFATHRPTFHGFSALMICIGQIVAIVLQYWEHRKGNRIPALLTFYWFLFLCVDILRLRTHILFQQHSVGNSYNFIVVIVHLMFTLMLLILSCFIEPGETVGDRPSPEKEANFFSILSFWWVSPLMVKGYKAPLTEADLWNLNEEDTSSSCSAIFEKEWAKEAAKAKATNKKPSLSNAFYRAFGFSFTISAIFKAAQDALGFVNPLILNLIIDFVESPNAPNWHGYLYAVAILLAAVLQSIFLHQYFHRVMCTGMRLRSSTITSVFKKTLRLSNTARQSTTVGEIVNLMTVDAQRFNDLMNYFHMIWSAPLQIALAMYFLWGVLGASSLAGLGVMVLMIPLNGYIARYTRRLQVKQMNQKDARIKEMNEVLNGVKVIKLYAWEKPFMAAINKIREAELALNLKSGYLNAVSTFFWTSAPFFVSLVTFIVYTTTGHDLSPSTAFVSLALFNILRFPLNMLPMLVTSIAQASVSVSRVTDFLLLEETDTDNVRLVSVEEYKSKGLAAVTITNGTFSWTKTQTTPSLSNINLIIPQSKLVAIVGPVGCGKSSLVASMLGQMTKISGQVVTVDSIAYVAQQAWIKNATVKDNILFGKPFDWRRYNEIVSACGLDSDLEVLPSGDATEIGEKGINLSGGQKQRVSLARALYQDAELYVFDDPLSAVDSHVGRHIYDHVIGPHGLLHNKTRVLVTHGIHFLPEVDLVIVVRDGTITETGSYQNLRRNQGDFSRFISEFQQQSAHETTTDDVDDQARISSLQRERDEMVSMKLRKQSSAATTLPTPSPASGKGQDDVKETDIDNTTESTALVPSSSTTKASLSISEGNEKDGKKKKDRSKLIEKEVAAEGSVTFGVYRAYFAACGTGIAALVLIIYLAASATSIGQNYWLADWSNTDANISDPTAPTVDLPLYIGVYAGLGFANSLTVALTGIFTAWAAIRASRALHSRMMHSVLRSPMSFFDTTPIGRIVNRFAKDMYTVDETIPSTARSFISTALSVVSIIVAISISTPLFLAAVVPLGLLYYYIQKYYVATSRQLKRLDGISRSPVYAHFSETINGVATIRAYGKQQSFCLTNEALLDTNIEAFYPSLSSNRWLALRLEMVGNVIIFLAAIFAVVERSTVNAGLIGFALSYALSVTQSLNWMVRMSSQLESDIVAVERVEEYCKLSVEAASDSQLKPASNWPQEGVVIFDNYATRYRQGLDLVLKGINAQTRQREKVGIVGRTGAGKSSLTLALFRMIEPVSGRIIIDGQDITGLGLDDLRSRITIMPQDPILFSGTIRSNLDPFNSYSDNELWRSLTVSHLHEVVSKLDGKLEAKVSEGGDNFSVGQRQLMCLARAVLRKTRILVLDEATAACDMETDSLIQQTIREEFADCTILTIAHRLNTILDSDRVMVLDNGRIAEFAPPRELLANPSSIFHGMCRAAGIAPSSSSEA